MEQAIKTLGLEEIGAVAGGSLSTASSVVVGTIVGIKGCGSCGMIAVMPGAPVIDPAPISYIR